MERNALTNAQNYASETDILVNQAIRASPQVQPIGRVDIARGSVAFFIHVSLFIIHILISAFVLPSSMMSDVFFDSIFTDLEFHSKSNVFHSL